jgi:hypothetical protein
MDFTQTLAELYADKQRLERAIAAMEGPGMLAVWQADPRQTAAAPGP